MGRAAKNLHHNILSGSGRKDYSKMSSKVGTGKSITHENSITPSSVSAKKKNQPLNSKDTPIREKKISNKIYE